MKDQKIIILFLSILKLLQLQIISYVFTLWNNPRKAISYDDLAS